GALLGFLLARLDLLAQHTQLGHLLVVARRFQLDHAALGLGHFLGRLERAALHRGGLLGVFEQRALGLALVDRGLGGGLFGQLACAGGDGFLVRGLGLGRVQRAALGFQRLLLRHLGAALGVKLRLQLARLLLFGAGARLGGGGQRALGLDALVLARRCVLFR